MQHNGLKLCKNLPEILREVKTVKSLTREEMARSIGMSLSWLKQIFAQEAIPVDSRRGVHFRTVRKLKTAFRLSTTEEDGYLSFSMPSSKSGLVAVFEDSATWNELTGFMESNNISLSEERKYHVKVYDH